MSRAPFVDQSQSRNIYLEVGDNLTKQLAQVDNYTFKQRSKISQYYCRTYSKSDTVDYNAVLGKGNTSDDTGFAIGECMSCNV